MLKDIFIQVVNKINLGTIKGVNYYLELHAINCVISSNLDLIFRLPRKVSNRVKVNVKQNAVNICYKKVN